ncbi:bifunctional DNA primase/polymerase [Streptomyces sp. CA-106131]|uniref:bifunctional DNA primase/polymerase n=1 Tax=Streptomyces sp. CA-106131 TaxID=3240045 RepID=UPI003D8DD45D
MIGARIRASARRASEAAQRSPARRSGGFHLYFAAPPGVRLGNTAGRLGKRIDTRAWGGHVVAPAASPMSGSTRRRRRTACSSAGLSVRLPDGASGLTGL